MYSSHSTRKTRWLSGTLRVMLRTYYIETNEQRKNAAHENKQAALHCSIYLVTYILYGSEKSTALRYSYALRRGHRHSSANCFHNYVSSALLQFSLSLYAAYRAFKLAFQRFYIYMLLFCILNLYIYNTIQYSQT